MENAELYKSINSTQRSSVMYLLNKGFPYAKFRSVPNQRVLDIGCGPGDVTESILLPYLPADSQVVGVDLSANMIKHAKEQYASNPRIQFQEYDLDCCDADVTNKLGRFDKIFSFWTFHWIRNHQVALQNVYNLLKPGGEILFLFSGPIPFNKIYGLLAEKPQWSEYLREVKTSIPPYHVLSDPHAEVERIAKSIGFQNIQCTLQSRSVEYSSFSDISNVLQAVDPFLRRIPENLRESFISDSKTEILKAFSKSSKNEGGYSMKYEAITLYASK